MIGDDDYNWREIEKAAAGNLPGPLRNYPFLVAALDAAGYHNLDPDMHGVLVRAVCTGAMRRRMAVTGDDD
jgi:hypothetical protein